MNFDDAGMQLDSDMLIDTCQENPAVMAPFEPQMYRFNELEQISPLKYKEGGNHLGKNGKYENNLGIAQKFGGAFNSGMMLSPSQLQGKGDQMIRVRSFTDQVYQENLKVPIRYDAGVSPKTTATSQF